ncbi:MAG: hypothetical protein WCA17_04895 [Burkholderiales bacterium]
MLTWLRTGEVDRFVDGVVGDLVKQHPPGKTDPGSKKQTQRLIKIHQSILDRVGRFTRDNKLSLYQKAHLGNRFKWALREAGYAPAFVDAITQEVVTVATLARKGR